MKITVVTVSYNSAGTIRRTIESVLQQNHKELEYIVIDGGSTDGTVDILREYADKITYWCSEPDRGIYDAMNKGIIKSTGKVIAFLNSDDWYEDNVLGAVEECFLSTNADIVYGNFAREGKSEERKIIDLSHIDFEELHYEWPFCHQAMFFAKAWFDKIGLYNENYKISADYEWVLKAYVNKAKFVHLPKIICTFSIGGFSTIHEKKCADEVRSLCFGLMPKGQEGYYIPKINQRYENLVSGIVSRDIRKGIAEKDEIFLAKINNILMCLNNGLCVWGAGQIGTKYIKFFKEIGLDILAIMDNNSNIWGERIEGVEVVQPKSLGGTVFIAVKKGNDEILQQLLGLGYSKEDIYKYREIEWLLMEKW